ncbi:Methyl-CpG DNA binding,F-box domain,Leucine-rich repeat domain, L domain-like,DNA-binding domain [Cinara cedri]|uniref:Methyl-CpG DNA binding,F-box domain,Leucine-rich repeat domain, L domain-like,DNA-binding domain n=1 Tax=Cinara cedri TaxID=506608 RepID=A0A5E4NLV9_9HEMI|nr:Methyl-CpG DNA binding,F-box domain,Leucine-rich repeat domain, L domain-like,DNA-binding domain [Cinara cedri]
MEQFAKKSTSNLKESKSKKLLKSETEDNNFIGFDAGDDELTMFIEKKKKLLRDTIAEVLKVSTDEPTVSKSNSNNNRLEKKSQSKSRRSTPENNVKKFKKDNLQTESVESFETDIQDSLELTTPTFSLTSTPRSRRSSGRRTNIDITDPIYKLPFDHGWKRELVYRTLGDPNNTNNKTNRNGDVYYYSPINKKLRSLREIQEQLDLSDSLLTIESFTFLKQPIGMNDRSKELIREANSKSSKDDSVISSTVKSKKTKTPTHQPVNDFELSDNENTKMKIRFKNIKKLKSRKENKNNLESLNTTTTMSEYMAEERQESTISSPKLDDMENSTNVKQRTSEMNGLPTLINSQHLSMQSFNYMSNSLKRIFQYLKMKELLTVTRVCSSWRCIAKDSCLWQNVRLKNAMVCDWKKLIDFINMQKSISLDTRRMLMPSKAQDFDLFWLNFSKAITNAINLEALELYRCPMSVVHDVMCSLRQLEKFNATSIKNPNVTKDAKIVNELMFFNIDYVSNLSKLTEFRIKGLTGIKLLSSPKLSFSCLTNLKTLSLTSIKSFPKDICTGLGTISTSLEILEIGDCESLPDDFPMFLKKLTNLRSLRLENCCGRWEKFAKEYFDAIRSLKKLKKLELINIEFSDCVEQQLEKCDGITALLIIPAYVSQSATTNCHLLDCLEKLSKTLTHVVWGLTHELLRVTDLFITQYQQNQHNLGYSIDMSQTREPSNNIPILRSRKPKSQPEDLEISEIDTDKSDNVDILSVPSLQGWLDSMMVNAKTKVIKIPFSATTRAYLSEQFDDL